jgi:hypothetical protein
MDRNEQLRAFLQAFWDWSATESPWPWEPIEAFGAVPEELLIELGCTPPKGTEVVPLRPKAPHAR